MDVTLNLAGPKLKHFPVNGTDLNSIADEIRRRRPAEIGFRGLHQIMKVLSMEGPITGARIRAKPFIQVPSAKKISALSRNDRKKWNVFVKDFTRASSGTHGEYAARIQEFAETLRRSQALPPREFDREVGKFEKELDRRLGRANAARRLDRLLRNLIG